MIDFGALPPEINSGRMWIDIVGSAPLAASGAAWQALSVQLGSAAAAMQAVIAELAGSYMGPSSVAMIQAAEPFAAWLTAHAVQAEQSALLALHSAAVFETARVAHIQPAVIAENRAELATLVSTNFMGVNSPAIAANEALYSEYWAQDAAAMYAYGADAAGVTSGLSAMPFLPPLPTTDPAGLGNMAASVGESAGQSAGQAASTAAGAGDQASSMGSSLGSLGGMASSAIQPLSALPQALGSLASPLGSLSSFGGMGGMQSGSMGGAGMFGLSGLGGSPGSVSGFGGGSPVSASMGRGLWLPSVTSTSDGKLSRLSVPSTWTGAVERGATTKSVATAIEEDAPVGAAGVPKGGMMPAAMGGSSSASSGPTDNKKFLPRTKVAAYLT